MAVAVVGKLVVAGRKLLEALSSDAGEVPRELRVRRQDHRPPGHEAVDHRLLSHDFPPFSLAEETLGLQLKPGQEIQGWKTAGIGEDGETELLPQLTTDVRAFTSEHPEISASRVGSLVFYD